MASSSRAGDDSSKPLAPGDRVIATFEDGSTIATDVLIGTDGIHSRVRTLIDPTAPAGRYVGLTNFGGVTPAGRVSVRDLEPETRQFIFGERAFFGAQQAPNGDIVWFVNAPRDPSAATSGRTRPTGHGGDGSPACSSTSLACRGADPRRASSWVGDNTYDLGHVPVASRRMVIIGDAAHAPAPSSGQGASLAMEDGVVLAMALQDASTIDEGLVAYERARRDRVERVVARGTRSGSAKMRGPWDGSPAISS